MEQKPLVLFHHQDEARNVIKDISLIYKPDAQAGMLKIEEKPYELNELDAEPFLDEIKPPFSFEYWWNAKEGSNFLMGSYTKVTLHLIVHTKHVKLGFKETLKAGFVAPLDWEYSTKTLKKSPWVFKVNNLTQLYQQMRGLENLSVLEVVPKGDIANEVHQTMKRMKFQSLSDYAVFEKLKKVVKIDEVNCLPNEERNSVAEQLIILANSAKLQFGTTEIPLRITGLCAEIENISSKLSKTLSRAQKKLIELKEQHQTIIEQRQNEQEKMVSKSVWYAIAGVVGLILYILQEFVL